MEKPLSKKPSLIFMIIICGTFISPLFMLSSNSNFKTDDSILTEENIAVNQPTEMRLVESNISRLNVGDFALFDTSLSKFLSENQDNPISHVKVIILFKESISKGDRVSKIGSILEDCEIIYNYDIIPAIYAKVQATELIKKENLITQSSSIEKIFKSKVYEQPFITQETNTAELLNSTYYPNWWIEAINAADLPYNGSGVKVAVIDSGIYNHSDLNLVQSVNFIEDESWTEYNDTNGHGTHVAGIIGGNGNLSGGIYRGIAPGVSLYNARAGGSTGGLEDGDIIAAIEWCSWRNRVDIISMSFGGGYPEPHDPITLALSEAVDDGIICVASAGNSGPEYFTGNSPGVGIDVISVGATNHENQLANFSSRGPTFTYSGYPDMVAPGVDIISTCAKDSVIYNEKKYLEEYFSFSGDLDYIPLSGTSMACPMVVGALALLKEAYPYISPETARIALLEGSKPLVKETDCEYTSYGAGLIDVKASLSYLDSIATSKADINDVAKICPDDLPVIPYDLINYPGDHQKINLTILSGKDNTFKLSFSSINPGLSLSLGTSSISFPEAGIGFIELDMKIEDNAEPGTYEIDLRLIKGAFHYDGAKIRLTVKLPEYRILMDSFHGLNDMYPELTYNQLGFYDAIKQIYASNIDVDYSMDYWSPDYNSTEDNGILTAQKLAQYDLLVLQNPILPYTSGEIRDLKNYYFSGGDILFLGTIYQDLCAGNINLLFEELDCGIEILEENVAEDEFASLGTVVYGQDIENFSSSSLFSGVDKFFWNYGCRLNVSGTARILANNSQSKPIVVEASRYSAKIIAFGGMNWIHDYFTLSEYKTDHSRLLFNLINYFDFLHEEDLSINIKLGSEEIDNSNMKLSVYLKNQTTNKPLNRTTPNPKFNLSVTVVNQSQHAFKRQMVINMNMSLNSSGIYYNYTFNKLNASTTPYRINVTLKFNDKEYSKFSSILIRNPSLVPAITSLSVSKEFISRSEVLSINATLSRSNCDVNAYIGVSSFSYQNKKIATNRSLELSAYGTKYGKNFNISSEGSSGHAFYTITALSQEGYYNSKYLRQYFKVSNKKPVFNYENSEMSGYSFTELNSSLLIVSQNTTLTFNLELEDPEDQSPRSIQAAVLMLICVVTDDGYLSVIYPNALVYSEIEYYYNYEAHRGSLKIPDKMEYGTINGTKSISTATDYHDDGVLVGLLLVSIVDEDGSSDDFYIFISIEGEDSGSTISSEELALMMLIMNSVIFIIVIGVLIVIVIGMVYLFRREPKIKRRSNKRAYSIPYQSPGYSKEFYEIPRDNKQDAVEPTPSQEDLEAENKQDPPNPISTINSLITMGKKLTIAGFAKQAKEKYKSALKIADKLEASEQKERILEELNQLLTELKKE